ncbi:MAG TPA: hypothetical protein VFT30_08475 [Nitrospira sp.]|nr:hypothetical protein [Nitrospira sp.]
MRDWKGALQWYRTHQTAGQIGFDPDGMCLKVCRTARDIPARYLTARQAQDATPREHRVERVADLRRGMVGYFDDPNDSNTAGHIATMVGRVKGADVNDLNDTLWETNSVKANELVVVRGSYFAVHWGDRFYFGATWLNGFELDVPAKKIAESLGAARIENFRESRPEWDVKILDRLVNSNRGDLRQLVNRIEQAVDNLPDDLKDTRVKEFKEIFNKRRVLKMSLLNQAVQDGRLARVKTERDRLNMLIKTVLRK